MRARSVTLSALALPLLLLSGCATTLTCPEVGLPQPEAIFKQAQERFDSLPVPAERPHALLKFSVGHVYTSQEWYVLIDGKHWASQTVGKWGPYKIAPGEHHFIAQMVAKEWVGTGLRKCYVSKAVEFSKNIKEGEEYTLEMGAQVKFYRSAVVINVKKLLEEAIREARPTDLPPADRRYQSGRELYETGKYAEALRELDQSIALNANLDVAHVYRGMALSRLGKPQEAIQALDKGIAAARLAKRDAAWFSWPRFHKGVAFLQMNRLDQAIAEFSEVVALKPNAAAYAVRAEAYFARARASGGTGPAATRDLRNARSDLDQAVKLSPKDSRPWGLKAGVHFMLGEQEQGCEAVKRACELGDCRLAKEFTECR